MELENIVGVNLGYPSQYRGAAFSQLRQDSALRMPGKLNAIIRRRLLKACRDGERFKFFVRLNFIRRSQNNDRTLLGNAMMITNGGPDDTSTT